MISRTYTVAHSPEAANNILRYDSSFNTIFSSYSSEHVAISEHTIFPFI